MSHSKEEISAVAKNERKLLRLQAAKTPLGWRRSALETAAALDDQELVLLMQQVLASRDRRVESKQ